MRKLLDIAVTAALAAGREIMAIYTDPAQDFGIERKADNSPLTLADKAAHRTIVSHLADTGIPILIEEGAEIPFAERQSWQRLWVVDPLDGTKEFIKKNGEFTVNIALVENGVPVMGVILVPVTGELYTGIAGEGAWLTKDDEQRSLPLPTAGRPFTVVASRSHLSPETEAFIEALRMQHADLQMVSSGSSLKICRVAEGAADVYPRFAPTMEWDTAAGDAIARAAGFSVTDPADGLPLRYNKEDLHNPWFIVR